MAQYIKFVHYIRDIVISICKCNPKKLKAGLGLVQI